MRKPRELAYAAERGRLLILDGGQWQPAAAALLDNAGTQVVLGDNRNVFVIGDRLAGESR